MYNFRVEIWSSLYSLVALRQGQAMLRYVFILHLMKTKTSCCSTVMPCVAAWIFVQCWTPGALQVQPLYNFLYMTVPTTQLLTTSKPLNWYLLNILFHYKNNIQEAPLPRRAQRVRRAYFGRQTTDQQLISHLYETGHETYRIPRNNAK